MLDYNYVCTSPEGCTATGSETYTSSGCSQYGPTSSLPKLTRVIDAGYGWNPDPTASFSRKYPDIGFRFTGYAPGALGAFLGPGETCNDNKTLKSFIGNSADSYLTEVPIFVTGNGDTDGWLASPTIPLGGWLCTECDYVDEMGVVRSSLGGSFAVDFVLVRDAGRAPAYKECNLQCHIQGSFTLAGCDRGTCG